MCQAGDIAACQSGAVRHASRLVRRAGLSCAPHTRMEGARVKSGGTSCGTAYGAAHVFSCDPRASGSCRLARPAMRALPMRMSKVPGRIACTSRGALRPVTPSYTTTDRLPQSPLVCCCHLKLDSPSPPPPPLHRSCSWPYRTIVADGGVAMEYEPGEYTKLAIRQYAPRSLRETAEGKYWRRFRAPIVAKQVRGQAWRPVPMMWMSSTYHASAIDTGLRGQVFKFS